MDVEKDEDGNIVAVDVPERAIEEMEKLADMKALEHYREIYSDWKGRGKVFILNLYHWPLPLWLHDPIAVRRLGPDRAPSGWLDERSVVEFVKFAAFVAYHLNDLVDMWSTMNEPNVVYEQGYTRPNSGFPPGYLSFESSTKAARNMAQAHARAYDVIKEHSKAPVGLIYSFVWHDALNKEAEDIVKEIRKRHYDFVTAVHSGSSGLLGERPDMKGKLDWIGVNYYTRVAYRMNNGSIEVPPGYGYMCERGGFAKSGRPASDFGWEIYPEGLENILKDLHRIYGLPLMVTENGIADAADRYRPYYLVSHLKAVHSAMEAGADVRGYLHWSLTDNYEWAQGFRMRFGLVHVDFETKKRYLRPSALVFREIATRKEIPEELSHLADLTPLMRD